jgi:hypothetical protein
MNELKQYTSKKGSQLSDEQAQVYGNHLLRLANNTTPRRPSSSVAS